MSSPDNSEFLAIRMATDFCFNTLGVILGVNVSTNVDAVLADVGLAFSASLSHAEHELAFYEEVAA